MPSSCSELRQDVIQCVLASPCMTREGSTVKECLKIGKQDGSVPEECYGLLRSFIDCKRSLVGQTDTNSDEKQADGVLTWRLRSGT